MGQTVVRIPNTKVLVQSDGMWVSEGEPNQSVVELTDQLAESLAPAYAGNLIDSLSDETENPLDTAWDYAEIVMDGVSLIELPFKGVEIVQKLNEWINGPGPDPMAEALERIDAALNRIEDTQLATWKAARGDNLAFLRAHSSTALQTTKAFLEDGRPRGGVAWAARIALAERDSLIAVHTFTRNLLGGYWLRPASLKAISWAGDPHDWMAIIPGRAPDVHNGLVWDHRWALPAAIYAITVRIAVLKAFDSGTTVETQRRCEEAKDYAAFLTSVFNQMHAGIRRSWLKPEEYPAFSQGRFPAAAVDLHGGYFIRRLMIMGDTRVHLPPEMIPGGLRSGYDFESLKFNVELLNHHWYNYICIKLGLPDLLILISRLQDECAFTPRPIEYPDLPGGSVTDWLKSRSDPRARESASVARALARAGERQDSADNSSRIFEIYTALRARDEESRDLVGAYRSQLSQIGSRILRARVSDEGQRGEIEDY